MTEQTETKKNTNVKLNKYILFKRETTFPSLNELDCPQLKVFKYYKSTGQIPFELLQVRQIYLKVYKSDSFIEFDFDLK